MGSNVKGGVALDEGGADLKGEGSVAATILPFAMGRWNLAALTLVKSHHVIRSQ